MCHRYKVVLSALAIAPLVVTAGCTKKEKATVLIRYKFAPSKGLPAGMKSLAVLPMKAESEGGDEAKWQEMATAMMQSRLMRANDEHKLGLQIADRKNVDALAREKDAMRAGLVEMNQAQEAAKLINVQGLVMGRCIIKVEKHVGEKKSISGAPSYIGRWGVGGVRTEKSKSISRNVTVQVTYRLVDAANGKTWYEWSPESPITVSDKKSPSPVFGGDRTEADLDPVDEIVAMCVEEAVTEFLSYMVPVAYEFQLDIESSGQESCVMGVKMIRGEDLNGAIDSFKAALAEDPEDHRAAFNLGVVYEMTGKYDEALDMYKKACVLKNEPEYIEARDRVKKYKDRAKQPAKTA